MRNPDQDTSVQHLDKDPLSGQPPGKDPFEMLEAYLDGELSSSEQQFVDLCLAKDSELARELAFARRIQSGLQSLPKQACPEAVTARAIAQVPSHQADQSSGRFSLWSSFLAGFRHPPARLAAGFALLMLAFLSHRAIFTMSPLPQTHESAQEALVSAATIDGSTLAQPSAEDVAKAEEDVKLALAYLGKLGRTASNSVVQMTSTAAHRRSETGRRHLP